MRIEKITSNKNDKFKELGHLHQKKWRDRTALFLVEGKKEILQALRKEFTLQSLWFIDSKRDDLEEFVPIIEDNVRIYQISKDMFSKIGYRENTEGIIGVFQKKEMSIERLNGMKLKDSALIIVADNVEKPGNLGALFRIADGVGASAIILTNQVVDVYNPNIVRNSVGTFFNIPFYRMETKEAWTWLKDNAFKILIGTPNTDTNYYDEDLSGRVSLIIGNEHSGVSKSWVKREATNVKIPMNGSNDSLNVSVSAGIITYEWYKQNNISK